MLFSRFSLIQPPASLLPLPYFTFSKKEELRETAIRANNPFIDYHHLNTSLLLSANLLRASQPAHSNFPPPYKHLLSPYYPSRVFTPIHSPPSQPSFLPLEMFSSFCFAKQSHHHHQKQTPKSKTRASFRYRGNCQYEHIMHPDALSNRKFQLTSSQEPLHRQASHDVPTTLEIPPSHDSDRGDATNRSSALNTLRHSRLAPKNPAAAVMLLPRQHPRTTPPAPGPASRCYPLPKPTTRH